MISTDSFIHFTRSVLSGGCQVSGTVDRSAGTRRADALPLAERATLKAATLKEPVTIPSPRLRVSPRLQDRLEC